MLCDIDDQSITRWVAQADAQIRPLTALCTCRVRHHGAIFPRMTDALGLLLLAAAIGAWLAFDATRDRGERPTCDAGAKAMLHGVVGSLGLAALVVSLDRHPVAPRMGLGGFGAGAELLLGLALCLGLSVIVIASRGRRIPGLLLAIHATLAIAGISLVLAIAALA